MRSEFRARPASAVHSTGRSALANRSRLGRAVASAVVGGAAVGGAALAAGAILRARRRFDLESRVALITGGSRGLGFLLAREFADNGCRIVICARDGEQLRHVRKRLEDHGAEVLAIVCDVADPEQVEAMVEEARRRFGRIDIVVNNAGIIQVGPIETMTREDFREIMDTVFGGTLHTSLAVLPAMLERGEGRIVNITSIGARVAVPHLIPYDAAKFAQRGLSEGLAAELDRHGIVVTTVMPGLMRTGSPVNALFKGRKSREFTWFSIGDSLPLTAMSAERAARRIVEATRRGERVLTLTWQAKLLGLFHDLFPEAFVTVAGMVNRVLPHPDGADTSTTRGMHLATPLAPSPITAMMNRAAREYNQYGGQPKPTPEHGMKAGVRG